MQPVTESLTSLLAERLRSQRESLVCAWLDRIQQRVTIEPERLFPSSDLIDHVPVLIDAIANYLEDSGEEITADVPAVAKAMELGAMRHAQGFPVRQILWEYEILGGVIFEHLSAVAPPAGLAASPGESMRAAQRVFRAIAVIERTTTLHYLQKASAVADEREQRLRGFARAISHELKNSLSAVLGASAMLREGFVRADGERVAHFADVVYRNARQMRSTMENLIELSRLDGDTRQERNVQLPHVVAEVIRQLREFAAGKNVDVRAGELPAVDVPASVAELCLSNLISNAIKYREPERADCWVEITALLRDRDGDESAELVVEVRDNGRGVPPELRDRLFERFYRADADEDVDGSGLGLSIVRDAARSVGGDAWADFPGPGLTIFAFSLPSRRQEDRDAIQHA